MTDRYYLSKKIFAEMVDSARLPERNSIQTNSFQNEGIVSSVTDFIGLLVEASDIYAKTNNVPDSDKIIISEDIPRDLLHRINNETTDLKYDESTLRDIRVVTYSADEKPSIVSANKPADGGDGIRHLKWRLLDVYPDPDYTGFSIARFSKEIDAEITFNVWGTFYQDIRVRSRMLRDTIDFNVWYFKHKGLRDIVWLRSQESSLWDGKSMVKIKTEVYKLRFTQLRITREKDLEQVVLQLGVDDK